MLAVLILLSSAVHQATARCSCSWMSIKLRSVDDYRSIATPDYPRNYCPGIDCSWTFDAPLNKTKVIFSTSSFDLRKGDELLFYSSKSRQPEKELSPLIHRCTWEDSSCWVETPLSYVTIRFISLYGGQQDHGGFQAQLTLSDGTSILGALVKYSLHLLVGGLVVVALLSLCLCVCCLFCRSPKKTKDSRRVVESRLL